MHTHKSWHSSFWKIVLGKTMKGKPVHHLRVLLLSVNLRYFTIGCPNGKPLTIYWSQLEKYTRDEISPSMIQLSLSPATRTPQYSYYSIGNMKIWPLKIRTAPDLPPSGTSSLPLPIEWNHFAFHTLIQPLIIETSLFWQLALGFLAIHTALYSLLCR